MKRRVARVVIACGLVASVVDCGPTSTAGAPSSDGPTGSLSMALRTEMNGFAYRLRGAIFDISGPQAVTIRSDDDPDAVSIEVTLRIGDYQIRLADGWQLERSTPSGSFEAVVAQLASENPRTFTIQAGRSSPVSFQFRIPGTGTLDLSIQVIDESIADGGAGDGVAACIPDSRFDFTNGIDDDCDGLIDEDEVACDGQLDLQSMDPNDGARALGLCRTTSTGGGDWGVISARWTLPDGQNVPAQDQSQFHRGHGLLPDFGPAVSPRQGVRLLALSTGAARSSTQPGFVVPADQGLDKRFTSAAPAGFPLPAGACPMAGVPHDAAALELTLRVPLNAEGFSFDFDYYASDWPQFVCQAVNDVFAAIINPPPAGALAGNVVFDANQNPVSVNGVLGVCSCDGGACDGPRAQPCAHGEQLIGTGFEGHAATGWSTSRVPAVPGSIVTVRFLIYDSQDGNADSTVLLDNFRWLPLAGAT